MNAIVRLAFGCQEGAILRHDLFKDRDAERLPKAIPPGFRQ
jgi:hypothetical protein